MASIQETQYGELACLEITLGEAKLLMARQGAQVLSYSRGEEPPIIWLSPTAQGRAGRSVRGGIPVCWPWFGIFERNPKQIQGQYLGTDAPQHGLVRGVEWHLEGIEDSDAGVTLGFTAPPLSADWPAAALELRVRLDDRLHIELRSENRGAQPLYLSQALHSYYQVGDIRQARVEGLDGCHYLNTVASWDEQHRQSGQLTFNAETDRIYRDPPERLSIVDPVLARRILLTSAGAGSAVLWNPWVDKAARLSDFPADGWQQMLCIETANVLERRLALAPGRSHSLRLAIEVQPLAVISR